MKCDQCWKEAEPGTAFCAMCGARLPTVEQPEREAATPVTAPAQTAAPAPAAPAAPPPGGVAALQVTGQPQVVEVSTSGWAVASLILALCGFTCFPIAGSVLAIIFGFVARRDIKRKPGLHGKSMANAGLIIGSIVVLLIVVVAAVVIPLSVFSVGKVRTYTSNEALGGARSVDANLDMSFGTMTVRAGSSSLLDGTFTTNVTDWKPVVTYTVSSGKGNLIVKQPSTGWWHWRWGAKNTWDVQLDGQVPINLDARLTGGKGNFELDRLVLSGLNVSSSAGTVNVSASGQQPVLKKVTLDQSAGELNLNLNGAYQKLSQLSVKNIGGNVNVSLLGSWRTSMAATIDLSAGQLTVTLPTGVGVIVDANTSGGRVVADPALRRQGNSYVNGAYKGNGISIKVNAHNSAGDIHLVLGGATSSGPANGG